jgi:hypothetical protein
MLISRANIIKQSIQSDISWSKKNQILIITILKGVVQRIILLGWLSIKSHTLDIRWIKYKFLGRSNFYFIIPFYRIALNLMMILRWYESFVQYPEICYVIFIFVGESGEAREKS